LRLACALAAALSLNASVAWSQSADVATGRAAFDEASFASAARAFEHVLVDPNATRTDLVEAHRYLASLRSSSRDRSGAEAHAAAALALDPSVEPPDGSAPDVARMFQQIRTARHSEQAHATVTMPEALAAHAPSTARAVGVAVPAGLDVTLRLRCERDGTDVGTRTAPAASGEEISVDVPALDPGARLACVASLETRTGVVIDRAAGHATVPGGDRRAALTTAETHPNSTPAVAAPPSGGSNLGLILGIGGGAVAAVAIAVIAGVVLTQPTQAQIGGAHTSVGP
jgi:hypothetical protein